MNQSLKRFTILPSPKVRVVGLLEKFGIHLRQPRDNKGIRPVKFTKSSFTSCFWLRHEHELDCILFDARKRFIEMSLNLHPDRGGDSEQMSVISSHWTQIKKLFKKRGVVIALMLSVAAQAQPMLNPDGTYSTREPGHWVYGVPPGPSFVPDMLALPTTPPPHSTTVLKGAQKQLIFIAAVPVPTTLKLVWEWKDAWGNSIPMPSPGIVFELLAATNFVQSPRYWPVVGAVSAPPFVITKDLPVQYFRVRAKDVETGATSDSLIDWRK